VYIPIKLLFQNIIIKNKRRHRARWFNQVLMKSGDSWQKIEKERLWKEEIGDFSFIGRHKMENVLEEE
jgi:hypothetical protein